MSLNSMNTGEVKTLMQKRMISKNGMNSYADLDTFAPISHKSVKRYMNNMEASVREGKIKPESRVEPYLNIRNSISKAAGLRAITQICPTENIYSEDEVGIFLFGWNHNSKKKPQLVSTKAADEFLRRNNVSLSSTEDQDKQRAAHIGATVQAHTGRLTSSYLRINDSKFPETFKTGDSTVHKPIVWPMNETTNFYVVTCHPSVTDTTVSEYIGKIITHPAIFASQDATIDQEITAYRTQKPQDTVMTDLPEGGSFEPETIDTEAEGKLYF
jgi:hypothetical protein